MILEQLDNGVADVRLEGLEPGQFAPPTLRRKASATEQHRAAGINALVGLFTQVVSAFPTQPRKRIFWRLGVSIFDLNSGVGMVLSTAPDQELFTPVHF